MSFVSYPQKDVSRVSRNHNLRWGIAGHDDHLLSLHSNFQLTLQAHRANIDTNLLALGRCFAFPSLGVLMFLDRSGVLTRSLTRVVISLIIGIGGCLLRTVSLHDVDLYLSGFLFIRGTVLGLKTPLAWLWILIFGRSQTDPWKRWQSLAG
jgi:hypothetical protein